MPLINFHLVDGQHTHAQHEALLVESSRLYAEVLLCPIERIRAFITLHRPELFAVAGELVSASGQAAPYFSFIVLEGRSVEQRQRLLTGFTDLVVRILGVSRELVRGSVIPVHPENWAIGGTPASLLRQAEVLARAEAGATLI